LLDDGILEPDEESFRIELSHPVDVAIETGQATGTIFDDESCPSRNLLVNPSAEERQVDTEIPGWTPVTGDSWRTGAGAVEPFHGTAYFLGGSVETAELIQDVDVSSYAAGIDAGAQQFVFEGYVRSLDEVVPDTARIVVEYRDWENANALETHESGEIVATLGWQRVADARVAPSGTRWIRVRLITTRYSGTDADGYFDALALYSLRAPVVRVTDVADHEGDLGMRNFVFPVSVACPFYREITVEYSTTDDTAVAGEDYLAEAGAIVLPVGDTVNGVAVQVIEDTDDEPHETFVLQLDLVEPDETVPFDTQATGRILNDDWCPRNVGYWKHNPGTWPTDRLVIGGIEYDQQSLVDLLDDHSNRDASIRLARELMAAQFNLLVGSPPTILQVVEQADAFLVTYPPGSAPNGAERRRADGFSEQLNDYNAGPCAHAARAQSEDGESDSTTRNSLFDGRATGGEGDPAEQPSTVTRDPERPGRRTVRGDPDDRSRQP
jgi:hypothetical protein